VIDPDPPIDTDPVPPPPSCEQIAIPTSRWSRSPPGTRQHSPPRTPTRSPELSTNTPIRGRWRGLLTTWAAVSRRVTPHLRRPSRTSRLPCTALRRLKPNATPHVSRTLKTLGVQRRPDRRALPGQNGWASL